MVRSRPHDFMDRLIQAGLEVFGTKGFASSRMSDVAHRLGVSQGTLYNYVVSKEALFGLLVERGSDPGPVELPDDLPIHALPPARLAARLDIKLRRTFALPLLHAALGKRSAETPGAELAAILQELWETTATSRGHADALERSMPDLPREVQGVFFAFRRQLFDNYARYVASRMERGQFAATESPIVAARFLIENVTLFARHCRRDPDPSLMPDDKLVRRDVVALLTRSLVTA